MGIFDITDNFCNSINKNSVIADELKDQYNSGVKEHGQPIVSFTEEGKNVIYREEL